MKIKLSGAVSKENESILSFKISKFLVQNINKMLMRLFMAEEPQLSKLTITKICEALTDLCV